MSGITNEDFRMISNLERFGCGFRTVEGRKQYYAWHGYPNHDSDYITYAEISEEEYGRINAEYPEMIAADKDEAEKFREEYITGHTVIIEGWDAYL